MRRSRRTDGGLKAGFSVCRELPKQPKVRKTLDSPQRLCVAIFRKENDLCLRSFDNAALPRDAEFLRIRTADVRNDAHQNFVCHIQVPPAKVKRTVQIRVSICDYRFETQFSINFTHTTDKMQDPLIFEHKIARKI